MGVRGRENRLAEGYLPDAYGDQCCHILCLVLLAVDVVFAVCNHLSLNT